MFSFYKMCTVYKTQNGLFKIHENDYIIYKWVVNGYVFEHNLINKYLQGYIKDFKYIVDAGANIGCHAISYAGFNPSAIIYAFEPQKELYNILECNKRINHASNVVCINKALGHENKSIFMNTPLQESDGVNFGGTSIGRGGEPTEMITLDSLDLPSLDFIKMDIQGAEGLLVKGGRKTIDKYSPVILFEHDDTIVVPEHVGLKVVPSPFFELSKLGYNTFTYLGELNYITRRDKHKNFEDMLKHS